MVYPAAIVTAGYDSLASRWDDWSATVTPDLTSEYLAAVAENLSSADRVLELGCGTGRPVAEALAGRCHYRGIDLSPEMVRIASSRVPEGEFEVVDMRAVVVDEDSLTAVLAFYSIIHIPRDAHRAMFERILNWLAPGGRLVASLTGSDDTAGYEEDWLDAGPMFWSGFDPQTAVTMLVDVGFVIDEASVRLQFEGSDPVEFLWIVARKPG